MRVFTTIVVFMILFATAAWAPADTIYTNFGPGQTYDTDDPMSIYHFSSSPPPVAYAVSYLSNGDYTLDSVSVAFTIISPTHSGTAGVAIYSDGGGKPDTLLENLGTQFIAAGSSAIYTFNSSTGLMLTSGATYWVAVLPAAEKHVYWDKSLTDAHGYAQSLNDGASWTSASTTGITPVFSVSGTPVRAAATAAPLPSAAWAGLALLPIAGLARRRGYRLARDTV